MIINTLQMAIINGLFMADATISFPFEKMRSLYFLSKMIVHCGVNRISQQDGIIHDNNNGMIVNRTIPTLPTLNTHQFIVDKNQVYVYQNENAISYDADDENAISYSYALKGVIGIETDMDNDDDCDDDDDDDCDMDNHDNDNDNCDDDDDDDYDDNDINNPGPFDNILRNRFRSFVDADYLRNTLAFEETFGGANFYECEQLVPMKLIADAPHCRSWQLTKYIRDKWISIWQYQHHDYAESQSHFIKRMNN